MKKLIALGVVGAAAYFGHKKLKQLQNSDIVFAMKPEDINLPPKILQNLTNFGTRLLPYSGFCEITGCTHEVHSNKSELFQQAMSEHLSSDH